MISKGALCLIDSNNITSRRDTKYLAAIVCLTKISTALKMASAQRFQVNRRPISLMTQASAYNLDYLQTRELADGWRTEWNKLKYENYECVWVITTRSITIFFTVREMQISSPVRPILCNESANALTAFQLLALDMIWYIISTRYRFLRNVHSS